MARCPECAARIKVPVYGDISPANCKECGAVLELIGGDIKFKVGIVLFVSFLTLALFFLVQNEYIVFPLVITLGVLYFEVVPKFITIRKLGEVDDLRKTGESS